MKYRASTLSRSLSFFLLLFFLSCLAVTRNDAPCPHCSVLRAFVCGFVRCDCAAARRVSAMATKEKGGNGAAPFPPLRARPFGLSGIACSTK